MEVNIRNRNGKECRAVGKIRPKIQNEEGIGDHFLSIVHPLSARD